MKAAILARGLGSRMREADTRAVLDAAQADAANAGLKAMVPIGGDGRPSEARPFLDYVLGAVAGGGARDVALVIGPEHDAIRRRYERDVRPTRFRLTCLEQTRPLGTAHAVLACRAWAASEPFLVLNADNLYPSAAIAALVGLETPGLPVFTRAELTRTGDLPDDRIASFALLEVDTAGWLTRIVEKPDPEVVRAAGASALVSMNCWRFDERIFAACQEVPLSPRGELELPQAVGLAIARGVKFRAVPARGPVFDLSRRSDVARVSERLSSVVPEL